MCRSSLKQKRGLTKLNTYISKLMISKYEQIYSIPQTSSFIYKDKNGNIWCGSYYNGVQLFNPNIEVFSYIKSNNTPNGVDLSGSTIGKPINGDNGIWIPTEGGGVNFCDFDTKEISYIRVGDEHSTLRSNTIKCLH